MNRIPELNRISNQLRIDVIHAVYTAKSGHIGGSLSAADMVAALYFEIMKIDPKNPQREERDRFIMSKGHAAPVVYAALARKGFFDLSELKYLRNVKSHLQGAVSMITPGVDMSAGPLGQGLSAGIGIALGARYLNKSFKVYCMLGDGEMQEGQVWEAMMSAAAFRLGNLIAILDYNKVQQNGMCDEIMPHGDICKKIESFGWRVMRIDGHNMEEIVKVFRDIKNNSKGDPTFIVADTVKGKGVSFMEGQCKWHGGVPSEEEYRMAIKELGGVH